MTEGEKEVPWRGSSTNPLAMDHTMRTHTEWILRLELDNFVVIRLTDISASTDKHQYTSASTN